MIYYYQSADRVDALRRVAREWTGTRYANRGRAAGINGGVGCVEYALMLHLTTGALADPSALPPILGYADDWSAHNDHSLLDEWFIAAGLIAPGPESTALADVIMDPAELKAGDIVAFAPGRVTHHVGTMLDHATVTHSLKPTGVCAMSIFADWNVAGRARSPRDWFRYAIRLKAR